MQTNLTIEAALLEEQQLVTQLQSPQTQERAFRTLISTYKERLYWHIRTFLPAHDAADEVLQNTFVKVFRGIGGFRSDARLYTWLYKIATNEALSYLAKEKRYRQRHSFEEQMPIDAASEPEIDANTTVKLLEKAVAQLPEKQKLVFNLRYYQEMPYEEMSKLLGTSTGALKASYHHAAKKIENFLREASENT